MRRDFVANVSHELKTPIGALELLAETLARESDPAVTRPLADRLVKEADRLGRIVDDLLDLSLIEIQESPIRDPVPVSVLVEEALDRMQPRPLRPGIGSAVEDDAGDATVACDRRQVVSALTNLLDNAVKYSERGSAVEVRAAADGRPRACSRCATTASASRAATSSGSSSASTASTRPAAARRAAPASASSIVRHVAQAHGGEVTRRVGRRRKARRSGSRSPRASGRRARRRTSREHV